jgi:hypothetical protein
MLEPNDLPIVCLPLELPPEAAAELIAFLQQLTAALERHYAGELLSHQRSRPCFYRSCRDHDEPGGLF